MQHDSSEIPVAKTNASTDASRRPLAGPLRELRRANNWSLERLASASGVSRSMLSQIERGETNPTLGVTLALARAFGLSIGEMLGDPTLSSTMHVVRGDDREYHYRSDPDCQLRTLSPLLAGRHVEFYEVRLGPYGALRSEAHYAGTREIATVHHGRVDVESGQETETLGRGDSLEYRADVAHAIINKGKRGALVYLVAIYR